MRLGSRAAGMRDGHAICIALLSRQRSLVWRRPLLGLLVHLDILLLTADGLDMVHETICCLRQVPCTLLCVIEALLPRRANKEVAYLALRHCSVEDQKVCIRYTIEFQTMPLMQCFKITPGAQCMCSSAQDDTKRIVQINETDLALQTTLKPIQTDEVDMHAVQLSPPRAGHVLRCSPCSGHSRHNCARGSMHEGDWATDFTADDTVKIATQLKVNRRASSKRTLKPAAAQLKPARRPQQPWRGRTQKSDELQGIEKTVELLSSELHHVQQLPRNSAYAKHRQRLLTTALQLAEQQR